MINLILTISAWFVAFLIIYIPIQLIVWLFKRIIFSDHKKHEQLRLKRGIKDSLHYGITSEKKLQKFTK
jgi:hypothetical protein